MKRGHQQSTFQIEGGPTGRPQLVDTVNLVFWVALLVTVYSALNLFREITAIPTLQILPALGWAAVIQWTFYAAAFLILVSRHQLFVRRSPFIVAGALAWGGLVATYFASKANAAFQDLIVHWFGLNTDEVWITAFAAATNEEILKVLGVIVIFMLSKTMARSTLDGMFYGAMVGLGFQVVEDFLYTVQQSFDLYGVFGFLIDRGFIAGLFAHAVYTGVTGAGIGFFVSRRDKPMVLRIAVAVGCFSLAWLTHLIWDSPMFSDLGNGFLTVLVKGIPILAAALFGLRLARRTERDSWNRFVEEIIDPSVLTASDSAALQSHQTRRSAQKRAGEAAGDVASKTVRNLQEAQLRYVQTVAEEGPSSTRAQQWRDRITDLQRAHSSETAPTPTPT